MRVASWAIAKATPTVLPICFECVVVCRPPWCPTHMLQYCRDITPWLQLGIFDYYSTLSLQAMGCSPSFSATVSKWNFRHLYSRYGEWNLSSPKPSVNRAQSLASMIHFSGFETFLAVYQYTCLLFLIQWQKRYSLHWDRMSLTLFHCYLVEMNIHLEWHHRITINWGMIPLVGHARCAECRLQLWEFRSHCPKSWTSGAVTLRHPVCHSKAAGRINTV